MQPEKDYRNGDSCVECNGADTEPGGLLEWSEPELVPAAMHALNTMRKNKQFHDVVLHTGNVEVPAHRAVLAAVSPYLCELFTTDQDRSGGNSNSPLPLSYKLNGICEKSALLSLVDYAYTGRISIDARHARAVYLCAWQLRIDRVVARCGDYLVSSLCLDNCIEVRSLPGLSPAQLSVVDKFIAANLSRLYCSGSALLCGVPAVKLEVLQAGPGAESPGAVASLALHWLRGEIVDNGATISELASRTHLLYVATDRSLRDCAALPPARTDAPALQDYRRRAAQANNNNNKAGSKKSGCSTPPPVSGVPLANGRARVLVYTHDIAERLPMQPDWKVIAGERSGENTYLSVCSLGGPLVQVSVCARVCDTPLASPAPLARPSAADETDPATSLAHMERPRCAHGVAVYDDTIIVCGGYDRVECLKSCEQYSPITNTWSPLPDMRQARGRFNIALVDNKLFAVGGSDGHVELDSVEMLELPLEPPPEMSASAESGGTDASGEEPDHPAEKRPPPPKKKWWSKKCRLPLARSHAAVCGAGGRQAALYCIGGCTGQVGVRDCHVYDVATDTWAAMPPLITGRQQAGACVWAGRLWVLGGCDTWHCLNTTEWLALDTEAPMWQSGPALSTGRRSVAAVVWRGMLVALGGSDGVTSLRTMDTLSSVDGSWSAGPALREPRAALGAAALGDTLYAVGGFSGKLFLSSMEYLHAPDGEWTTLLPSVAVDRSLALIREEGDALVNQEETKLEEKEEAVPAETLAAA